MSLTLYVNKSDCHCECSYGNVDGRLSACSRCGGVWTHVSTDYSGIEDSVRAFRPDLIPDFPWEGWWQTEAGKRAAQELNELPVEKWGICDDAGCDLPVYPAFDSMFCRKHQEYEEGEDDDADV